MNFAGHIELGEWNGRILLTVQDYELLDFLEDHFTDMGIETTQVHPSESPACHQLLFNAGVSKPVVWQALESIGPEQIACIASINNNGAGSTSSGV